MNLTKFLSKFWFVLSHAHNSTSLNMTTAARPTFAPARGGSAKGENDLSALSKQYSSRDLPSHTKLKCPVCHRNSYKGLENDLLCVCTKPVCLYSDIALGCVHFDNFQAVKKLCQAWTSRSSLIQVSTGYIEHKTF